MRNPFRPDWQPLMLLALAICALAPLGFQHARANASSILACNRMAATT